MQPGWPRRAKCLPYEILMDLICGSPWGGSGGARGALHGASAARRAKLTCHCRISNSIYLLQNRASASVYSERWQEKRRDATPRLLEPPSGLHPSSNKKREEEKKIVVCQRLGGRLHRMLYVIGIGDVDSRR
jgi:hypothetical protein